MNTIFDHLTINQWRQIDNLDVNFHQNLTVITGANGSGKTTVLNLLNRSFGWNLQFVRQPNIDDKGDTRYVPGFWIEHTNSKRLTVKNNRNSIGTISYTDGSRQPIKLNLQDKPTYNINLRGPSVEGVHIPSHRPVPTYSRIQNIPTELQERKSAYEDYKRALMQYTSGNNSRSNPGHHIKQTIISWATFGFGNEAVKRNSRAVDLFEGFQSILKTILPPELGFKKIEVRLPELVLVTDSGPISFDAVSGGISSIIGIAWQIFMYNPDSDRFAVTIDEPENHLHPRLQRSFLPNLRKAFPDVQFIIATHSPLVVGSSRQSNIYVFQFNENNKVNSIKLDEASRSGTSDEILREVLGVPSTMPIWASEALQNIISQYSDKEMNQENMQSLKEDLRREGLENEITRAINEVITN